MSNREAAGPVEDVLDLGRPPRVPRWAYLAGGLLAAAVIAGVTVAFAVGSPGPPAAPASTPPPSNAAADHGGPADADDVLVLGRYLFRLAPDVLYRTDAAAAPGAQATLPISGLDALGPASSYHLIGDAAAHLVWLVGYGGAPTTLLAVDTDTMAVRARVNWPQAVNGAAALNGDLYVLTANAVVDVTVTRSPVDVTHLPGQYMTITADPARHRLLLLDENSLSPVSYEPVTHAVRSGPRLPFGKGDLLADGAGRVWAGGYGFATGEGAVLDRLDPLTLRPVASSPLAGQLGPGAQLVASGSAVIWLRSGAGGDDLWCVDGRTGRPAQHWKVAGVVASRTGYAVVDTVGMVQRLTLRGCPG
jgi:hypothetical protein